MNFEKKINNKGQEKDANEKDAIEIISNNKSQS